MNRRLRITLLLAPAVTVTGLLFGGGLVLGVAQSLGYQPYLGQTSLSLDAYRRLVDDPAVRASLGLTLRIALVPTVLAAVLGVGGALALRRTGRRRHWADRLFALNLAVPHLVGALCMLLLLSQTGLLSRLAYTAGLARGPQRFPALTADAFGWAIVAEYVWKEAPFVGVVALAALGPGVTELERAAATLGAGPWQRLRWITLPALAAPVGAASVLVLAFAAGSYEVPFLLGRPYPASLPVVAYQYYRDTDLSSRPLAMAAAVAVAALSTVLVGTYVALSRRLVGRPR